MPFGLHGFDFIALLVVALLVFGPKRLPQMGAAIGQTFHAFKHSVNDSSNISSEAAATESQIATSAANVTAITEPATRQLCEPAMR